MTGGGITGCGSGGGICGGGLTIGGTTGVAWMGGAIGCAVAAGGCKGEAACAGGGGGIGAAGAGGGGGTSPESAVSISLIAQPDEMSATRIFSSETPDLRCLAIYSSTSGVIILHIVSVCGRQGVRYQRIKSGVSVTR